MRLGRLAREEGVGGVVDSVHYQSTLPRPPALGALLACASRFVLAGFLAFKETPFENATPLVKLSLLNMDF